MILLKLLLQNQVKMKNIFIVENIKCNGCMTTISNALLKINDVEHVAINEDLETITIDGTIDREKVLQKLADLGYPEKGHNSIISKTKSYVSCAIGKISDKKEN